MSFIEIIATFSYYGADVIFLAAVTTVLVQIIKLTALKNAQKRVLTFLPFIIGIVIYAIYAWMCSSSFRFVLENYVAVIKQGFGVGALSTFIYVLYEQFIRKGDNLNAKEGVILSLIAGYVPSDKAEQVAKEIAKALTFDTDFCGEMGDGIAVDSVGVDDNAIGADGVVGIDGNGFNCNASDEFGFDTGAFERAVQIIFENAEEGVSEQEIRILVKLICKTLERIH